MFNVTVINAKKSLMQISIFIIIIVLVFVATKVVNTFKSSKILQINISEQLVKCLNYEIPAIESAYYKSNNVIKEDGEEYEEETFVGKILRVELGKIQEIRHSDEDFTEENQVVANNIENIPKEGEAALEVATDVLTQIVTQNPIAESYNTEINGVKIKN